MQKVSKITYALKTYIALLVSHNSCIAHTFGRTRGAGGHPYMHAFYNFIL